jgi:hypothetical protein
MIATQLALFAPPAAANTTGYVYYGTDGCNIKIGYSTSPRRRGGELKLSMLLTFLGGVENERTHHRIWAKHRIGASEWFHPAPELLEWLDKHVPLNTAQRMTLRMLIFRRREPA